MHITCFIAFWVEQISEVQIIELFLQNRCSVLCVWAPLLNHCFKIGNLNSVMLVELCKLAAAAAAAIESSVWIWTNCKIVQLSEQICKLFSSTYHFYSALSRFTLIHLMSMIICYYFLLWWWDSPLEADKDIYPTRSLWKSSLTSQQCSI